MATLSKLAVSAGQADREAEDGEGQPVGGGDPQKPAPGVCPGGGQGLVVRPGHDERAIQQEAADQKEDDNAQVQSRQVGAKSLGNRRRIR